MPTSDTLIWLRHRDPRRLWPKLIALTVLLHGLLWLLGWPIWLRSQPAVAPVSQTVVPIELIDPSANPGSEFSSENITAAPASEETPRTPTAATPSQPNSGSPSQTDSPGSTDSRDPAPSNTPDPDPSGNLSRQIPQIVQKIIQTVIRKTILQTQMTPTATKLEIAIQQVPAVLVIQTIQIIKPQTAPIRHQVAKVPTTALALPTSAATHRAKTLALQRSSQPYRCSKTQMIFQIGYRR